MLDTTRALVDLRSDTLTKPTDAMRHAMAIADVGDDVYGEDPNVNALEEEVAALFGRESALFTTSGVQANLLAMHVFARPGTEVIVEEGAHLVAFEAGASAMFAGIQYRTVVGDRGRLTPELVTAALRPDHFPYTEVSALCVEETTNLAGGTFIGAAAVADLRDLAHGRELSLYADGARIFNAIVAGGGSALEYGAAVDGLAFCASKGLGAPVGSLLVGDAGPLQEARGWRRRHGGAMRQAGVLAAAARHALEHHVARLADDHANARALATALAERVPGCIDPDDHPTNILYVETGGIPAQDVVAGSRADGVFFGAMAEHRLRLVTHLGVDAADVAHAADVIARHLLGRAGT